jgi:GT2 family glycosyltransferase
VSVPHPDLSVIITSYNARTTIAACLDSLRAQATSRTFEILLVDSSADGTAAFVREAHLEVVVLSSPDRLFAGSARNLAIPHARAPLIAFLDADCTVEAGWVDAVCAAHAGPGLLVGGSVDNAPTRSLVAWAYYFCEFNLWLPAARSRAMSEAAGCCLSMKREAFERYGPFLEATYSSDTAFQWRARRDGQRVHYIPSIRVIHQSPTGLGHFLRHTAEHRRGYARVKCLDQRLSAAGRRQEMALLPITPVLLIGATLVRLRVCPRYLPRFLVASPLVFLGYAARSWGEFTGYLSPDKWFQNPFSRRP